MELIFKHKIIRLDNQPKTDEIIENIYEMLDNDNYFSHFIAEGIEVFENHEEYLNKNINDINQIEIKAKTIKEFVNDILLTTEGYINRARPQLVNLSEEFYDNPNSDTWNRFTQLIEGIQWINEMLTVIENSTKKPSNWIGFLKLSTELKEELINLKEAMENIDNILIGDLIQYEIMAKFESLGNEIKITIDTEGTRYDLN